MIGIAPFAQLALLLRYNRSAGNLIPLMRLLSMSASSWEASGLGFNVEVSVPQLFLCLLILSRMSWVEVKVLPQQHLMPTDILQRAEGI